MDKAIQKKPAIYMASRASIVARPELWNQLRDVHGLNIVSTWHNPENMEHFEPKKAVDLRSLWTNIQDEIAKCDVLCLYVEPNDLPLKGAFIEAGIALAFGKRVVIAYVGELGKTPDSTILRQHLGSWIAHPRVMVCETLETAMYIIHKGIDYAAFQAARS